MSFGLVLNREGRRLYVVLYDPLTGKHRPLSPLETEMLKSQMMEEERFEELRRRVKSH